MDSQSFEALYTRSAAGPPTDRWLSLVRGVGNNPVLGPVPTAPPVSSATADHGCVFLDPRGQCSIYAVRPVQCRTYPFWPSLVDAQEDWDDEAVLPDDALLEEGAEAPTAATDRLSGDSGSGGSSEAPAAKRHWSLEEGGCEGIGLATAERVGEAEIESKRKLALRHWRRFPDEEIKQTTWYL